MNALTQREKSASAAVDQAPLTARDQVRRQMRLEQNASAARWDCNPFVMAIADTLRRMDDQVLEAEMLVLMHAMRCAMLKNGNQHVEHFSVLANEFETLELAMQEQMDAQAEWHGAEA